VSSDALSLAGLPAISQAKLPASVRNGTAADKKAYTEALGFEQVLMNELAQELSKTVSDGTSDGSSDGGLLGSDPSTSGFSSMLPQALSSSIMSGGGLGLALPIAQSLDPSLGAKR